MKKVWKWILGILGVLVLVGALFAVGFFWRGGHNDSMGGFQDRYQRGGPPATADQPQGWQHPPVGECSGYGPTYDHDGFRPMMGERGGYGPMMGGYYPGFGGGFFLGGLLHLIVFLGLLYGAYWLGRRNARITLDPKPVKAVAAPPAPEPESPPASDEQA